MYFILYTRVSKEGPRVIKNSSDNGTTMETNNIVYKFKIRFGYFFQRWANLQSLTVKPWHCVLLCSTLGFKGWEDSTLGCMFLWSTCDLLVITFLVVPAFHHKRYESKRMSSIARSLEFEVIEIAVSFHIVQQIYILDAKLVELSSVDIKMYQCCFKC